MCMVLEKLNAKPRRIFFLEITLNAISSFKMGEMARTRIGWVKFRKYKPVQDRQCHMEVKSGV